MSLKAKRITAVCIGAAALCGFIILYLTFGRELLALVSDRARFDALLDSFGSLGAVVFTAIRALQTVVKIIPAEPLEIASGYMYGTWGGLALCSLGSFIGSVVILLLTRTFGTKITDALVPKKKLSSFSFLKDESKSEKLLFWVYLIPSTPKDIITYMVGLTKLNPVRFLLITSVARIPSIITSTYCGAQLGQSNYTLAIAVFVLTAVVGFGCSLIYNRIEKSKSVGNKPVGKAA